MAHTTDQAGESPDAHGGGLRGRFRRWRGRVAVPVLAAGIASVSVLSAVVTWRASEWSNRADRYERLAMQDTAFRHQLRAETRAGVDEDLRIFGDFEEHYNHAVRLESNVYRVYYRDQALAGRLTREAQHERASANGVRRYLTEAPGYEDDSGLTTVNAKAALRHGEAGNPDLANVRRSPNADRAEAAQDKARNLVGVALLFAASLFFLTIAQLTARATSRGFALAGTSVAVLAWALFIAA
jgi:hypothetical protein